MFTFGQLKGQVNTEQIYLCPKCNDQKGHLYVNSRTHLFFCQRCGYKGKLQTNNEIETVTQDFQEVRKIIIEKEQQLLTKVLIEPPTTTKLDEEQLLYLESRLNQYASVPEYVAVYKIRNYQGRIYFPIFNLVGDLVFYTARTTDPKRKPRYVNAKVPKNNALFGLEPFLEYNNTGLLIITEGIFSALSFGIGNAVALLGKSVTKGQLKLLSSVRKRIKEYVVCLDADASLEALQLVQQLPDNVSLIILQSLTKKDPNYYTKQELHELISTRVTMDFSNLVRQKILNKEM